VFEASLGYLVTHYLQTEDEDKDDEEEKDKEEEEFSNKHPMPQGN
jgi:hypothetical protein